MHDEDPGDKCRVGAPHVDVESGELNCLLRQIEKEPVPERLLQLALKLQQALVHQRTRVAVETSPLNGV